MSGGRKFFAAAAPKDWEQVLAELALFFHFQPSELWEMDAEDMMFWMAREQEILERRKSGG